MAVEKHGTKTDAVVKLVIVFFVCLLSFSIGIFVGKKFSDNQHKVAKFEPESHDRDIASVPADSHEVKPTDPLTDDEVAKLAEEFISDEKMDAPESHGDGHTQTDKNHETGVHESKNEPPAESHGTAVAPMQAAAKVARNENPTKVEQKVHSGNRIPSSLPKEMAASAIGKYTVQVASYPDEKEAQKMSGDLKTKGFSAFYVSAKVKDRKTSTEKTWYRVSVGLFSTQKEAEAYKNDLLTRSKVSSAIVQKITE